LGVAGRAIGGRFATQVDIHLRVEHAFESRLHQHPEQAIDVIEGLGLAGDLASKLLSLCNGSA
jgi:hypothetical protein